MEMHSNERTSSIVLFMGIKILDLALCYIKNITLILKKPILLNKNPVKNP